MRKYRVLVVDDLPFYRDVIRGILERSPQFEVIGEAANGGEAVKEVILKAPDLITLDLEMPGMDGFTFLRWLMFAKPTRTVVVTSRESNRSVFKALELGAVDFMIKPSASEPERLKEMETELLRKLAAAADADLGRMASRLERVTRRRPSHAGRSGGWRRDLKGVVIASSTGGPPAVQAILQGIPEDFPVPILVNQHMPAGFTGLFARRLAGLTRMRVKEAEDGESLAAGTLIAPGGHHMFLDERGGRSRVRVVPALPADRYVPSADRIFASAAEVLGTPVIGVVLTGMGEDGALGLAAVKRQGGTVIAEDESTCVVYGMPRAAVERGLADHVLPLPDIPELLTSLARGGGRG